MAMSKKDYQAIAAAFYRAGQITLREHEDETWQILRREIADVLAADNPRFDRARFIEACETGHCKGMPKRAA